MVRPFTFPFICLMTTFPLNSSCFTSPMRSPCLQSFVSAVQWSRNQEYLFSEINVLQHSQKTGKAAIFARQAASGLFHTCTCIIYPHNPQRTSSPPPHMRENWEGRGDTLSQMPEPSAGIFKQSMGARNRVGKRLSYRPDRATKADGIDSLESIPGLAKIVRKY